jgi:hypothetical protein
MVLRRLSCLIGQKGRFVSFFLGEISALVAAYWQDSSAFLVAAVMPDNE